MARTSDAKMKKEATALLAMQLKILMRAYDMADSTNDSAITLRLAELDEALCDEVSQIGKLLALVYSTDEMLSIAECAAEASGGSKSFMINMIDKLWDGIVDKNGQLWAA